MNKVLVLLAAYNGEKWIGEQLDSIFAQTGVEVTVVVSDDCSMDSTVSRALAYADAGQNISVIEADFSSGSASANFFRLFQRVDVASFDYVAFSDQDDIWNDDKLALAVHELKAAGADGYSSGVTAFWSDGRQVSFSQSPRIRAFDHLFEGAGQGCTFVLTAPFFKSLQEAVRTYEDLILQAHYHDWMTYLLARVNDRNWVFDDKSTMRYRQHAINDTGAKYSLAGVAKRLHLIRSGWYAKQILIAVKLAARASSSDVSRLEGLMHCMCSGGVLNRVRICFFVLKYGRRKSSDRFVLAFAALMGWLFVEQVK